MAITVKCGVDPGGSVLIETDPPTVELFVYSPATWQVSGLPPGYSVQLNFDPTGKAPQGLFPNLGPEVGGTSNGSDVEISGDSFNPPHPKLRLLYPYTIVVTDPHGKEVGRQDPTIDNQGFPPEPAAAPERADS